MLRFQRTLYTDSEVVRESRPEAHAFVQSWVPVNSLDGDADGAGARQRAEVVERSVPRSQESDLEVLRLLMSRRQRCCHDDGRHRNQH